MHAGQLARRDAFARTYSWHLVIEYSLANPANEQSVQASSAFYEAMYAATDLPLSSAEGIRHYAQFDTEKNKLRYYSMYRLLHRASK